MNIFNNKKGMTLIETLVSVSVFSLIMLSVLGIFKVVIEDQRNSISSQNIQEGIRYTLEMMAKEIRAAQPSDKDCYDDGGNHVFNLESPSTLHFKNKDGICVTYFLDNNNRIKITRDATPGFITGSKVRVSNLEFIVSDNLTTTPPGSRIQPKVTIKMDLETTIGRTAAGNNIKIQTTVSSRIYE